MKKIILFCLAYLCAALVFAQKETFDIVSYTPPAGWKKEVNENVTTYTIIDKKTNGWCQVGIIKSTISKGTIDADFNSEWQELIVKTYSVTDAPQANEVQEADGWKIKAGGGKFIFNNANAMAMLTTISGYNRCVSIVSTTNSQDYLKDVEALLSSVDLAKPKTTVQPQGDASDTKSVIGTWGATASDNSSYRMKNGIMNYISRQYYFNADGTYNFVSKAFDPLMDKILLGKESGTYQMSGNNLIVTPKKSVLEAWSKKDGTDKWGKKLNSQNIPLEKSSYQFTKHYFSGTQIWALVLQGDKATNRDGPFSSNDSYTNAWYYNPISPNNPVIELPDGQKLVAEEIKKVPAQEPAVAVSNGFHYTTTNFDDGWTSTVQEDWVEVTKANIKVLIHYPNKKADAYNSVLLDGLKDAWNILVAPRYTTASNMEFKPIINWQSIEFAEADMVEKGTGKTVHVVLFKINYSGGNGKYMEFITPTKTVFEQEFDAYHQTSYGWEKMEKMANYNKFAVAASDLNGKWTTNFTGIQQYVNAYTGASAGMDTHASSEKFEFTGNTYKWEIAVASGFVGNIKFQGAKSNGKFSLPGIWQVSFTDIEGKPRTYNAFFACIKGARVLWLGDTAFAKSE